jgi:hypothetical protein
LRPKPIFEIVVYGDGMAYVEHRTPPLQRGRSLYVWMRMSDVVGQDRLLEDVLKFAAAKIGASPNRGKADPANCSYAGEPLARATRSWPNTLRPG